MTIDRYWLGDESGGWTLSERGDPYADDAASPGGFEWGFHPVCSTCAWEGGYWQQRNNALKELSVHIASEHSGAG